MPETNKFERNLRILRKKHILEEIRMFWKKFVYFGRNSHVLKEICKNLKKKLAYFSRNSLESA